MKNIILAGAAALAFTAVPAAADHHTEGEVKVYTLGEDQLVVYEGWPEDRRVLYDAWPYGVQEYYWTLEPTQSDGWWMLTDPQRVRIYEMTPEQRAMAWQQINAQLAGNNNASTTGVTARTTAATTTSPAPRFVRSEVTQTTPAGYKTAAQGEDLPVCTPNQQDGCINSWEKNKTGTRPLEYWPGRPASEIDRPLPATKAEWDSSDGDDD